MASVDKVAGGWRARWRPRRREPVEDVHRKTDATRHLASMEHSKLTGAYVDPAAGRCHGPGLLGRLV